MKRRPVRYIDSILTENGLSVKLLYVRVMALWLGWFRLGWEDGMMDGLGNEGIFVPFGRATKGDQGGDGFMFSREGRISGFWLRTVAVRT